MLLGGESGSESDLDSGLETGFGSVLGLSRVMGGGDIGRVGESFLAFDGTS